MCLQIVKSVKNERIKRFPFWFFWLIMMCLSQCTIHAIYCSSISATNLTMFQWHQQQLASKNAFKLYTECTYKSIVSMNHERKLWLLFCCNNNWRKIYQQQQQQQAMVLFILVQKKKREKRFQDQGKPEEKIYF